MIVTVEEINGLYIIVDDGVHRFMDDSTFEQLMNVEVGDDLEVDIDVLMNGFGIELSKIVR